MTNRKNKLWTMTVSALVMAIWVGGCSGTPREVYMRTQDVFISVVQQLNHARAAGRFSQNTWAADVLPWINAGNEALDILDVSTRLGKDVDPSSVQTLADALAALQRILATLPPNTLQEVPHANNGDYHRHSGIGGIGHSCVQYAQRDRSILGSAGRSPKG